MSVMCKAVGCLLDDDRTRAFGRAISRTVRSGDSVLDCGTGTGILAILAAKDGARPVIAVEKDKAMAEVAISNVKSSGFADKVQVYCKDAAAHKQPMSVVVMSMMDTCMIAGDQMRVANALVGKGVITTRTKTIPLRCCNFFEPVCYDFEFEECHMPMVVQSNCEQASNRCIEVLGSPVMFGEIAFNRITPTEVRYVGRHFIQKPGWLNAIKFSTVTYMTEDMLVGATAQMNAPIYVPVHEMSVKTGDVISVELSYTMGGGLSTLEVNVS